jgi:hypothetical protein
MRKHASARGAEGGTVKVKRTVDLCPSGQFWVNTRSTEEVERKLRLWNKAVPKVEGEFGVDATEASDKMVLERADGSFCGIPSMDARGYKLIVHVFFLEKILENSGAFVVEALQARAKASFDEACMDGLEWG